MYKNIVKKYKVGLILLCLVTIFSLVLDLIFPYINGAFIDNLISKKAYSSIVLMVVIIFVLGLINAILKYFIKYKGKEFTEYIVFDLKKYILDYLRNISILDYKKYNSSYLNKRIDQDTLQLVSFFIENFVVVFTKLIQLIVIVVIMISINLNIAMIIICVTPLYYLLYKYFRKSIFKESLVARERSAIFFQAYNDQLEYMEDINLEANYKFQDSMLDKKFKSYFESTINFTKTTNRFNFSQGVFALAFQIIVFLFGGYYVVNNYMTVGELTMITTYFSIIMSIIAYYIELGKSYQITKTSKSRIEELLNISSCTEGDIIIDEINEIDAEINFSYDNNREILSDFKLRAKKGDIVGLIGTNGSGKTTVSKLIVGTIKNSVEKMQIKYNKKHDISDLNSINLREGKISYIPQKIRYINIRVSEIFNEVGDYTECYKVVEVLESKGIEMTNNIVEFIENSWNKKIDELSGGDKQLIFILKNLVKNTDLLILDEPSSNLDKDRIAWLKNTILTIKKDKIILIITHDENMFEILSNRINVNKNDLALN